MIDRFGPFLSICNKSMKVTECEECECKNSKPGYTCL